MMTWKKKKLYFQDERENRTGKPMRGACQKVKRRDRKLKKFSRLFHITPCVKVDINYLQMEMGYRLRTNSLTAWNKLSCSFSEVVSRWQFFFTHKQAFRLGHGEYLILWFQNFASEEGKPRPFACKQRLA